MSSETAKTAIDFLFDKLQDSYLGVTFFGGEPLLKFSLMETIVSYVNDKQQQQPDLHVRFAVNTNGTILHERIAQFLVARCIHVFLSIDGHQQAHDTHRVFPNQEGSFFAVEKNLETFLQINPYLVTISVITPETVRFLKDSVCYLYEKGVRLMMLTPDYTAFWDAESFSQLENAYRQLADFYLERHRAQHKVYLSLFDARLLSHIHAEAPRTVCRLADTEFSIAPDGTIFPCVQFINADTLQTKIYAVGHVAEGWWTAKRAQIICQSHDLPGECVTCALNGRCPNYCGCLNVRTTGKINDVSPFRCTHERMLFPIVDHVGNTLFEEQNELFLRKFYDPEYALLSVLEDRVL
jgi:uncharacterized protein